MFIDVEAEVDEEEEEEDEGDDADRARVPGHPRRASPASRNCWP